ncbi:high-affinity glucose transporter [Fusarium circinatum]|uniref:High-affinity glucose transporter n=1 Tax=Fusarium circinatum TaxID=48490 RepID=A0A8H5T5N0_FUSCI|nr:high-affinity glucose transporter [Fusarium circinatum]
MGFLVTTVALVAAQGGFIYGLDSAIIEAVLQCAAANIGMMITGRLIAGIGCGQILSVVPIYLAEVSKPGQRGFLIQLERDQGILNWFTALGLMFSRKYVRRTLTASFVVTMSQLSGSSVIQNFQSVFYQTVGFTGRTSLLISGVYGMMGIIGQVIYLVFVADKMPRTRTLWSGSIVLCVKISICMALSAEFGSSNNENQAGARGAIVSIFLYSMSYAVFFNDMIWVVPSEIFPFFLRTKGMALAVATKAIVAIVLSQITPLAIANVGWRYYSLFISSNAAAAVFYFFFLPETSGKSLEEIAALFGDDVIVSSLQTEAKITHTTDGY